MSQTELQPLESFLKKKSVLFGISKSCLSHLLEGSTQNQYRRRQVVFYENNKSYGMYFLIQGRIKIYKTGKSGRQQILHIAVPGEMVGVSVLGDASNYLFTAEALEESKVVFFEWKSIMKALRQDFQFVENFLHFVTGKYAALLQRLEQVVQKDVRSRIAGVLCNLMGEHDRVQDSAPNLLLSRSELGELADTTQETTVRIIKEFSRKKLIHVEGKKITLLNSDELKDMSEG